LHKESELYCEQLFSLLQGIFIDKHTYSQKRKTPDLSSACASLLLATKTAFTVIAIGILTSKYAYLNIVYFGLAYI